MSSNINENDFISLKETIKNLENEIKTLKNENVNLIEE